MRWRPDGPIITGIGYREGIQLLGSQRRCQLVERLNAHVENRPSTREKVC